MPSLCLLPITSKSLMFSQERNFMRTRCHSCLLLISYEVSHESPMPTPIPTKKEVFRTELPSRAILDDIDVTFDDSIRPSSGGNNAVYATVAAVMRKGRATIIPKRTTISAGGKVSLLC